jgi:hypothetical protein
MPYLGRQPGVGVRNRYIYTATASQTTFSGADDNGATLAYDDGAYVDVYLNGVLLIPVTDYAATTKTSVVLTSGAAASDLLEILAYEISSIADTVSKANGGTFDGAVTVNNNFVVDNGTIKLDGNYPVGTGNVALGDTALDSNVSGNYNTAIGADALTAHTASYNTAVGYKAGYSNSSGQANVSLGHEALYSTTDQNNSTGIGFQAAYSSDTAGVTAVGAYAAQDNTTGAELTAVGYFAAADNTSGSYNVAVGPGTLRVNTTSSYSTAVGYQAGYSSVGAGNTFIGYKAGYNSTASGGSVITYVGYNSGSSITSGEKNTILGPYTGNQGGLDIRTWNNYIVLSDGDGNPRGIFDDNGVFLAGATTAINQAHTLTRNVANSTVVVDNTHASNPYGLQVRYSAADPNNSGNIFLEAYGYNGSTLVQRFGVRSNGGIANYQSNDVNLSDERVKKDIAPLGSYWDKIKALGIVTFKYKDQTHDDLNIGVIAQQVEDVAPEFVSNDGMGDTPDDGIPLKTIYTADMYHAAIKALQEAMERIETLEAKVAALENA